MVLAGWPAVGAGPTLPRVVGVGGLVVVVELRTRWTLTAGTGATADFGAVGAAPQRHRSGRRYRARLAPGSHVRWATGRWLRRRAHP